MEPEDRAAYSESRHQHRPSVIRFALRTIGINDGGFDADHAEVAEKARIFLFVISKERSFRVAPFVSVASPSAFQQPLKARPRDIS